jgi:hypothetical protein
MGAIVVERVDHRFTPAGARWADGRRRRVNIDLLVVIVLAVLVLATAAYVAGLSRL